MSFHCSVTVKGRKPHRCEQCRVVIVKGEPHTKVAGSYYGDFYFYRVHVECEAAAQAYWKLCDYRDGDDWPWFRDGYFERGDRDWMREHHPIVATRLGWDNEPCTNCDVNRADPPSKLCPGCQAYREHQA